MNFKETLSDGNMKPLNYDLWTNKFIVNNKTISHNKNVMYYYDTLETNLRHEINDSLLNILDHHFFWTIQCPDLKINGMATFPYLNHNYDDIKKAISKINNKWHVLIIPNTQITYKTEGTVGMFHMSDIHYDKHKINDINEYFIKKTNNPLLLELEELNENL